MMTALAALICAGCPDDIPRECKETCALCCDQEADCSGDAEECYSTCYENCQRAYAVYRNSACWEARLDVKGCVCSLTCTELTEFEEGTADHCAPEIAREERDCDWF
jgi:hypothetical protein